jgi:hypothetical protein
MTLARPRIEQAIEAASGRLHVRQPIKGYGTLLETLPA